MMKKLIVLSLFLSAMTAATAIAACTSQDDETAMQPAENPDTKTLVAYFSATGNTRAVAEQIAALTGANLYRIEAADPYAENPYDDSDRIQREAYNDLRPEVADLPSEATIAKYDTIFVGTPTWWHQPAMVVCTFLEAYDLSGKVVVPFATYGATTYLNETLQKLYKCTPNSTHIPATLPEDLDPDDIQHPQNDDAGIDQPGNARSVEAWLRRMGLLADATSVSRVTLDGQRSNTYYTMSGVQTDVAPTYGVYITNGMKYLAK